MCFLVGLNDTISLLLDFYSKHRSHKCPLRGSANGYEEREAITVFHYFLDITATCCNSTKPTFDSHLGHMLQVPAATTTSAAQMTA